MENEQIDTAINLRIAEVHSKYETRKSDFDADYDELAELFQGVVAMLHAYEILDCKYDERTEYIVAYHKLKKHVFGFDAVHSDNYESSIYFSFSTAREAFQMIAELLTI